MSSLRSNVAFYFDFDGLLANTHQLQAKVLMETLSELGYENQISEDACVHMLEDGDEETFVIRLASTLNTEIAPTKSLVAKAWERYIEGLEMASKEAVLIHDSVLVLKLLFELGFSVCIVTNSRRAIVEKHLHLLEIQKQPVRIVTREDVELGKPNPDPYLLASSLFPEATTNIAFEDSPCGVRAASQAGMTVIALCQDMSAERVRTLHVAGASQVVSSLCETPILESILLTPFADTDTFASGTVKCFTRTLTKDSDFDQLAADTYGIYKHVYSGRTFEQFRQKLFDSSTDVLSRVGEFYENDELTGYAIMRLMRHHVSATSEEILLVLVSAGSLASGRGQQNFYRFYATEMRRIALVFNHEAKRIVLFDNFLSPSGFALCYKILGEMTPSPTHTEVRDDLKDIYLDLLATFRLPKATIDDETVRMGFSAPVKTDHVLNSTDPIVQFFKSKTQFRPRHGIAAIAPAGVHDILPSVPYFRELPGTLTVSDLRAQY